MHGERRDVERVESITGILGTGCPEKQHTQNKRASVGTHSVA
jgi:hypothetical protein